MKKYSLLIIALIAITIDAKAQVDSIVTIPEIEIILSKKMMEGSALEKNKYLADIGMSESQNLILATNNSFYCIGYGGYVSRSVGKKSIKSFCIIGNDVYFADKNALYKIDTNDIESKVMSIPFTPQRMWAGKKMMYAVKTVGKESRIYAFLPNEYKTVCFYTASDTVICVKEFRKHIMALTNHSLLFIDAENRKYAETPIDNKVFGKLISIAFDEYWGAFYLATSQGVYRVYEKEVQMLCKDTGTLCYDKDGIIIFNAQDPYVIRLRNNLLYAPKKGVNIEIR